LLDKLRAEEPVALLRLQLARRPSPGRENEDCRGQIDALVVRTGTHLAELYGIGPIIADRILAEVETIDRFPSKDHFPSYTGTAPIDASSGEQVRHLLSRAGNRRLNHALHMMAVTQIRNPGTPSPTHYQRKRLEGKTPNKPCAASNASEDVGAGLCSCGGGVPLTGSDPPNAWPPGLGKSLTRSVGPVSGTPPAQPVGRNVT
jgi:Transposase IS116/IS110/IS902 family